jgi:hypothetical protein
MMTKQDFSTLMNIQGQTCVSIYSPTHRAGKNQEDEIRFKNLLQQVGGQLETRGWPPAKVREFLGEAYALLERKDFWLDLSDCLAVYLADGFFQYFKLPIRTEAFHRIDDQFYLRPVLPLFSDQQRFFLLALSQNEVRFFEGHAYSISPVKVSDLIPSDMEEALNIDEKKPGTQLRGSTGQPGSTPLVHGHQEEQKDKRLKQYFRRVDEGLMEMLHDESVPMVLAAVDYLVPIYREISKYPHILSDFIPGNPEQDDPVLLHEKAWPILQTRNERRHRQLKDAFFEKQSKGKATTELSTALRAAEAGQIEVLYLSNQAQVWGRYDSSDQTLAIQDVTEADGEDLLDRLAKTVWQQGGAVYQVVPEQMPDGDQELNAILRY